MAIRLRNQGRCADAPAENGPGPASWIVAAVILTVASGLRADVATYRLVIDNTWSERTHPGLFPGAAHFSWLGGGVHGDRVSFWQEGEPAS